MMGLNRLMLNQRQHTIAATESEESDLKERDEQTEKYHKSFIFGTDYTD